MFDSYLNIHDVKEIRARSLIYFGCGAIQKIDTIAEELKKKNISKVLLVTSAGAYKTSGAWDIILNALSQHQIAYAHYDKVTPNPTTESIDEATQMALNFGAKAVIGVGGGSPIDTAKSVAILMEYPNQTAEALYEWQFAPEKAAPIVAINLTHGTGTEGNRVAVASILSKNFKPAIAYECIYPTWSIDDPNLMLSLPKKQILYTSIDALNHVVEAATTKCTNPFAITLAREVILLVHRYLPVALENPQNLVARYHLAYAALLGGISFDNGFLHLTHALEHPLSAVKPDLTHGLGLAMLLPSVIETIYPASAPVLADILAPIVPDIKGIPEEGRRVACAAEQWLFSVGCTSKLSDEGYTAENVEELTKLTFTTPSLPILLSVAPVEATQEVVAKIYHDSLKPISQ